MPKLYEAPFYTEDEVQEMEEKDMSFPYSSKYMRYDSLKRQYVPTEALLLKHNISLADFIESTGRDAQADMEEELEYISDQVYACIDRNSGSNSETLRWLVAKSYRRGMTQFRVRLLFEEILWKQAKFYVENDDLTKSSGVDMEQKQWLNKGVYLLEDRYIDSKVKTKLTNLGLCWRGSYDEQFCGLICQNNW